MAMTRWDPLRDFGSLQERINRVFGETIKGLLPAEGEELERATWAPAVDINETEDSYVIKADLPGMSKDDIQIDIRDNTLTIRGEKKFEEKASRENYIRVERSYGTFVRSFTLPPNVEAQKIQAKFKDGVLELTLPKKEEAKPKQISINVS